MQSCLGAMIRLDTGLQRRTTTNHTILVLSGTVKAENRSTGTKRSACEAKPLSCKQIGRGTQARRARTIV